MKKVFTLIALVVLFFGAVPNAGAASLLIEGTPSLGSRLPMQTAGSDTTWTCYRPAGAGWITCPTPNDPMSPFDVNGTNSQAWPLNANLDTEAKINCTTRPACINDFIVFYWVSYQFQWSDSASVTKTVTVRVNARGGAQHDTVVSCGSGHNGSCQGVVEGTIPASELPTSDDANWDMHAGMFPNGPTGSQQATMRVMFSLMPIGNCEDDYMQITSDTYDIVPTIELPVGPPTDDQIYATVIDQTYRIEIAGGPWNDGTDDRKDVAASWDGVTWAPLVGMPSECSEQNAEGQTTVVYIIAQSETFYIRVNDTAGAFADNTNNPDPLTYNIGIAILQASPPCEAQFGYDEGADWVASVDVHGDDADGVLTTGDLEIGEWYAITVASGSWQHDGVPPDRYDMDYYNGPSEFALASVPYTDLSGGNQNTYCQSSDGMTAYIQAKARTLYLRVNDDTFANTGVLHVNVFHSTFTRTEQTCETQFNKGSLITSDSVLASQEAGKVFAFALGSSEISYGNALQPGAWYYLETTGGPWEWQGSGHAASGIVYDMAVDDGDGFIPLGAWTRPTCNVVLDGLGHRGVYFQIPETAAVEWKLRVDDNALWSNNSGSMSWNLYGATDLGLVPTDSCDFIYDPDHKIGGDWVDAKSEDGEWMQIYAGKIYAIKLRGDLYSWQESSGGSPLYDMQISNDDGSTWSDFPNGFGGTLCYTQAGNVTSVFIKAGQNQVWKMRVDSTTFSDNTGGMGYELFEANAGDTLDPWTACFDGNVASTLNSLTYIPVKEQAGIYINGTNILQGGDEIQLLQPGETYKVQIEEGPWNNGAGSDTYNADISADNGATWYAIDDRDNPNIICGDTDFIGAHKSVYFTVETGQKWKIRVGDADGEFLDNSGNLAYSLYGMTGEDVPPIVDITVPPAVVNNVCANPIVRPSSLLDVPKWIEYARQGMQKYFAWCPGHTDIMMAMLNALKTKEPFSTLNEWQGVVQSIRSEAGSYNWGSDSGQDFSVLDKSPGASYQMFQDHAYAPIASDNPWESGIVDIRSFENFEMPSAYAACQEYLAPQAGRYLAQGVCYASSMMLLTGASFWIQLILDFGVGALCVAAFWKSVQDMIAMATGVPLIDRTVTLIQK